jgi:hypothetical protein
MLGSCSEKTETIEKDIHPALYIFLAHYATEQPEEWQGDLDKSEFGDEYFGQGSGPLTTLFPDAIFANTELPGSQLAIGVMDGDWKYNANRVIARLPRPWWKLSPALTGDAPPAPSDQISEQEANRLANEEGVGFFLIPKSSGSGSISNVFFIAIGPAPADASKTSISVQSMAFPAWPNTPQEISASQDREDRLRRLELGIDESECLSGKDKVTMGADGRSVDAGGNPVFLDITTQEYIIGAELVDGKIVGGRRVSRFVPNCE